MTEDSRIPDIIAFVRGTDGAVSVNGARRPITAADPDATREAVHREVAMLARQFGGPVPFRMEDNGTEWNLIAHADGSLTQAPAVSPSGPSQSGGRKDTRMPGPATQADQSSRWPPQSSPSGPAPSGSWSAREADPDGPESERANRWGDHAQDPQPRHAVSFLPAEETASVPPQPSAVAPQGWWARLFGKQDVAPDPRLLEAQRAEAADQALVSKHWPGPKTIAVVNGKGGSGKTPTTALLAAVFARYGGGGVIAWDNNDTRGTLGWRTAGGGHDRTVLDLIPAAESLMDRDAQVGRLAYFMHHQPDDKYDVLRSNPELLAQDQRLSTEQFKSLHDVCNRFYRMILMDSGNDESTYAWLNMIEAADQIVVPTSTRPDHAEAGLLLLHALNERSERCRRLTDHAVVIVSQADQDEASADTIADGFRQLLPPENVVTIPYDRAIRDSQLRYDRLNPVTQRAFLRAAAAVAGQL